VNEGIQNTAPTPKTLPVYFGLSRGGFTYFGPAKDQYVAEAKYASFTSQKESTDPYGPIPEGVKRSIEKGGVGTPLSFEKPEPIGMDNIKNAPLLENITPKDSTFPSGSMRNTLWKDVPLDKEAPRNVDFGNAASGKVFTQIHFRICSFTIS
jgi:hypothetical protein